MLPLDGLKLLIFKIDKPQWKIGYRYGIECKPDDRQNGKALTEAISNSLRIWLKPLKELHPERFFTDKFVYELQADFNPNQPDDLEDRQAVDLRVTFHCHQGRSSVLIGLLFSPDVFMRTGTEVSLDLINILTHELGHAFGMADTYARPGARRSRGGLKMTAGKQPSSIMSTNHIVDNGQITPAISEDDKRGIIWIYKHLYEGLAADDCFFADYVFIKDLSACRPKHPLIFETKHNLSRYALQLLEDDPDIDINAQDVSGMTALHYAVVYEKVEVVKALLAHENIKPSLKNKQGQTPFNIAREAEQTEIIDIFLKSKHAQVFLDITPTDNVTTTWGSIKKQ